MCEDIKQGLVPCCQTHMTVFLDFFNPLDSCHPTQTLNIYLTSEVSSSKQSVLLTWALGKTAPHWQQTPNSHTPASQNQHLLLFFFAAADLEKGVRSERGAGEWCWSSAQVAAFWSCFYLGALKYSFHYFLPSVVWECPPAFANSWRNSKYFYLLFVLSKNRKKSRWLFTS